jgi:hypothetical protein
VGQELVQPRIEQANGHRQAAHDLEQLDEISPLHWQEFSQRDAAGFLVFRQDHLSHGANSVLVEEHKGCAAHCNFPSRLSGGAFRRVQDDGPERRTLHQKPNVPAAVA